MNVMNVYTQLVLLVLMVSTRIAAAPAPQGEISETPLGIGHSNSTDVPATPPPCGNADLHLLCKAF